MIPESSRPKQAFTLIELLCAIAIVILLASLIAPSMSFLKNRSETIYCANNLRQIDVAMKLKVQDNNNAYPKVESDPANPIYPPDAGAKTLGELLEPYGITSRSLCCPADAHGPNYFAQNGSSYQWFPLVDGEVVVSPKVYLPAGTLDLPQSRLPEAADFSTVHQGRQNILFADGHVKSL